MRDESSSCWKTVLRAVSMTDVLLMRLTVVASLWVCACVCVFVCSCSLADRKLPV